MLSFLDGEPNPLASPTTLLNIEFTQIYSHYVDLPGVGQGVMQKQQRT